MHWLEQVAALAQANKAVLDRLDDIQDTRPRGFAKLKQCILALNEALKEQRIDTKRYIAACVELRL